MDKRFVGVVGADGWPKLMRAAKVGGARFMPGVSARLVVEAAQRHYEDEVTPEKEAERIAKAGRFVESIKVAADVESQRSDQVASAQGEREHFEAWAEWAYGVRAFEQNVDHSYVVPFTEMKWVGWQARAALAQPSPEPELDFTHLSRRMLEELARLGKCLVATADLERLTQERDAAQARMAELEKQEPFYYFADCDDPDYSRLYNTEGDALSQISDHGGDVVKLYVAPVAQAGQVPEGWRLVPIEPLINMMSDKDRDTRIMAERQLLAMLAAAPAQGEADHG